MITPLALLVVLQRPGDVRSILQKVIDLPQLSQVYLADRAPERKPLVLVYASAPESLQLRKFDRLVVVRRKLTSRERRTPHLAIRQLIIRENRSFVRFSYDVEGVRGEVKLVRKGERWAVTHAHVYEI